MHKASNPVAEVMTEVETGRVLEIWKKYLISSIKLKHVNVQIFLK